jgi:hypothetical protein
MISPITPLDVSAATAGSLPIRALLFMVGQRLRAPIKMTVARRADEDSTGVRRGKATQQAAFLIGALKKVIL